ncbi:hypothetical protein [Gephyromycinifex aptenodytis]|uniref:hypothetical protein n=1 Tax=Gephyromycinifex aptenodytis TaxID=2716227 RepID=UPI001447589B|nr:hypothetical protein [Gephyromycinifex aptenodytis]
MYAALWRLLPGPWWVRLLLAILLCALVVWTCLTWLFPWWAELLAGLDEPVVSGANR